MIQAKNILTKNQFTLNKFPFLRFRQKITQTAHKIGLTFSTYLKLRFNRVIYNYTCTSPQLVITQKRPEPFTHDVSRYNQLQDKSRLSFIRHKRNTTLPVHQPNSFEERRAVPLTSQILQPVPFYTDRRSQMNELSRHSSASNVSLNSLNNPLSQRIDHPYSNSNNSLAGYSNTHPTNKTIEVDYGVENHASMARSNLIKHPFRTDSRSSDSLSGQRERNERVSNILQQPQSTSKHSNVLDKNNFKAHTTRLYEGSPVNLYFNVEGSKEIASVIPSNLINETTPGKLLPDNLNLDFTKITSPPANTSSTGNSQKKSDGLGGSKKFSPSVLKDENTRGKKGSGSKEKEQISPEDSESKRSAKLKMIPLNLRNALNEKADSNEKPKKDSFIGVEHQQQQPLRIVHKKKNSKSQNSHTKISSALDNIIKSQQRKTDRKSFLEEKSLEKSADRSRYTTALQVDSSTLKKRVKVNIDKHMLKAKIMKALQSSHTPTGDTNSHTLNHSFNYDALPGNISVDISKLDIDLDVLNRSLLNVHDEKEEKQYTSRFVGETSADSAKQRREANKENMPVNLPDKGVSLIKNVNLGQKEGKKIMPLLERPQTQVQKKSHLSLDTTVINLENENNLLKQSIEGLAKEKKKYKERSETLDKDLKKTQVFIVNYFN